MRISTVSEMYEQSVRASQDRWRASTGDMPRPVAPTTSPVRHDAPAAPTSDAARVDVAAVPKIADLYAKSVEESRNRWRNTGDRDEALRGGRR